VQLSERQAAALGPAIVKLTAAELLQRLRLLEDLILKIPEPPPPPEPFNLSAIHQQLSAIETTLRTLPVAEKPKDLDLSPIYDKLDELEAAISGLRIPDSKPANLDPVNARLLQVEAALRERKAFDFTIQRDENDNIVKVEAVQRNTGSILSG